MTRAGTIGLGVALALFISAALVPGDGRGLLAVALWALIPAMALLIVGDGRVPARCCPHCRGRRADRA